MSNRWKFLEFMEGHLKDLRAEEDEEIAHEKSFFILGALQLANALGVISADEFHCLFVLKISAKYHAVRSYGSRWPKAGSTDRSNFLIQK